MDEMRQQVFGFCDEGCHVRWLTEVRWTDSGGTKHGVCGSCLQEAEDERERTEGHDPGCPVVAGADLCTCDERR